MECEPTLYIYGTRLLIVLAAMFAGAVVALAAVAITLFLAPQIAGRNRAR